MCYVKYFYYFFFFIIEKITLILFKPGKIFIGYVNLASICCLIKEHVICLKAIFPLNFCMRLPLVFIPSAQIYFIILWFFLSVILYLQNLLSFSAFCSFATITQLLNITKAAWSIKPFPGSGAAYVRIWLMVFLPMICVDNFFYLNWLFNCSLC